MKILMVTKAALGVGQRKLEELAAQPGVEQLTVIVPPYWKEPRVGNTNLEKLYTRGYDLIVEPMTLNGNFHLHFYPGLGKWVKQLKPDLVFMEEESFNLATVQGIRLAKKYGAQAVFYNWANIFRTYPPPFRYFEQYNFKHADGAIAGAEESRAILRRKGFDKPLGICPQFGVDPEVSHRTTPPPHLTQPGVFTIGFAGRLVPEKGLDTLVEAASHLKGDYRLLLVGSGAHRPVLEALAERLGITAKLQFVPAVPSTQVPAYMSAMDVFVLPSLTRSNWKEQFGRVLIEAMACETPVIGSDSGEIPNVIGEAGLVFPEGNVQALAAHLQALMDNTTLRAELIQRGVARVQAEFTQTQIARRHYELFQQVCH